MKSIFDVDISNKSVLIRADLNVPIKDGKILSTSRIDASLECIRYALSQNAAVLLMSHLGRPKEGVYDESFSLEPIYDYLSDVLDTPVFFSKDYLNGVSVEKGSLCLLENVRFNVGEKSNSEVLSHQYASLADVLVMDAFGTCHRAQASTFGAFTYAKEICMGPLLKNEVTSLSHVMSDAKSPFVAVIGGAKVSTKFDVLNSLADKVDCLIVGGGIANTFIAAQGYSVGASLHEGDWIEQAKDIMKRCKVIVPKDVCVAQSFSADEACVVKPVSEVTDSDMILDLGPETIAEFCETLTKSQTIIWNGPIGVFEFENFSNGTRQVAQAINDSSAYSLAGGGDTLSAIEAFDVTDLSYISTGGGAFLEYVEGRQFPVLQKLGVY